MKFEGCYHGHGDSFLVKAGSGAATFGTPDSPGVTPATARDTLTAPFNDAGAVRELFAANPGEVAAVIVEPVVGNMGVVAPAWGFLQDLRDLCTADGALLIFDEVMTGFRVARGGAQETLRRHARPHHARQDHRRRPAGRRVRRTKSADGAGLALGPGLPGRHAVGTSRWRWPRAWRR